VKFYRFQTYFPHIDNVYSHRSTQRHKRKRFVSHYWDCRLKGRPPGTKKSTDPDKKKRKRVARERDLCDVKIKITEYFDGAELTEQTGQQPPMDTMDGNPFFGQPQQPQLPANQRMNPWGVPNMGGNMGGNMPLNQSVAAPKKFYTIQRVNGNGGNGKGDGVAGPHKHSLEESDKVKKNSVLRWMMKSERDKKRVQVSLRFICSNFAFYFTLNLRNNLLLLRSPESLHKATMITHVCNVLASIPADLCGMPADASVDRMASTSFPWGDERVHATCGVDLQQSFCC
jgi:hypothetical protein